jgi:hypothetical protein
MKGLCDDLQPMMYGMCTMEDGGMDAKREQGGWDGALAVYPEYSYPFQALARGAEVT